MPTLSEIEQDQADFYGRLSAEPYFADVGLYLLRPRANATATQIAQGIENALNCLAVKNGKGGAAVTVLMPLLQGRDPNVSSPQFDASITLRVQELPLTNMNPAKGTLKSAESIALEVARLCHHFRGGSGQIWTLAGGGIQPNLDFDPKVTYDVTLGRLMPISAPAKVAKVGISVGTAGEAGAEIGMGTATAGAAIHYTLDGSYPVPGAAGTALYAEPFTAPAGTVVRAAASKAEMQQSDVTRVVVPSPA